MTTEFSVLNAQEQKAVVTLCILAAFADGAQSETERAEIKRIVDNFGNGEFDLTSAYQQALSGKLSLQEAGKAIQSTNGKAMAYEMAVCICHVDGASNPLNPAEQQFLETLRQALGLDQQTAANFQKEAGSIASAPMAEPPMINAPNVPNGRDAELDKLIVNRAILAGALELMPQTLATMAIVPIQTRLVYQIGANYGYKLDTGHAKEFLATIGIGLTSQVVEGYLSRLAGNLTRHFAGRLVAGLVSQATESAVAFASTYAIGQTAKSYYASGRTLSATQLRDVFASMLGQGRNLKTQYASEIAQRVSQFKPSDLLQVVKAA
jgi:uncharacterized protein (DUF697 family)/tellurite resistance protein